MNTSVGDMVRKRETLRHDRAEMVYFTYSFVVHFDTLHSFNTILQASASSV